MILHANVWTLPIYVYIHIYIELFHYHLGIYYLESNLIKMIKEFLFLFLYICQYYFLNVFLHHLLRLVLFEGAVINISI